MEMRETHRRDTWLTLEAQGAPDAADQAFRTLSGGWRRVDAPADLVERVAALGRAAVARHQAWPWTSRAAVAASLLLTGLAAALTPMDAIRRLLIGGVRETAIVVAQVVDGVAGLSNLVAAAAGPIVSTARALAIAVAEPLPIVVLALNVVIASVGLAALRRLLTTQEV